MTGFRTVAELEKFMSLRELYEWYEYCSEEPFFADRIEIQLATICTMIGGFGKSKLKHSDYMISNKRKEEKTTEQKNEEVLLNFFFPNGINPNKG